MLLSSCTGFLPLALVAALAFLWGHKPRPRDERGDVIVQHLGVILLAIVALIALFAAIQLLGTDVISSIRKQLNL
jgi:hypothetical protein